MQCFVEKIKEIEDTQHHTLWIINVPSQDNNWHWIRMHEQKDTHVKSHYSGCYGEWASLRYWSNGESVKQKRGPCLNQWWLRAGHLWRVVTGLRVSTNSSLCTWSLKLETEEEQEGGKGKAIKKGKQTNTKMKQKGQQQPWRAKWQEGGNTKKQWKLAI